MHNCAHVINALDVQELTIECSKIKLKNEIIQSFTTKKFEQYVKCRFEVSEPHFSNTQN